MQEVDHTSEGGTFDQVARLEQVFAAKYWNTQMQTWINIVIKNAGIKSIQ